MLKRTLVALAFLSTFSAAQAANVSLYGAIDTGFTYTHVKHGNDKFEMSSGNYAGPRFGLKGSEQISDKLGVKYILEAGFRSDSGALAESATLFNRETQIALFGDWGTFGMGRVGAFSSGSSSLSWYWDMEPFETGYNDAGIQATQINVWRLNSNTLYYVSPSIAGAKLGIQYSLSGVSATQSGQWSKDTHWVNAALRWDGENTRILAGFEGDLYANNENYKDDRNTYNYKVAAAWQPAGTSATVYVGASYYKNSRQYAQSAWSQAIPNATQTGGTAKGLDAWSGFAGVKYTVGQGDMLAMFQYLDGDYSDAAAGEDKDYKRYVTSLGYHYHLSNRTMAYLIASYADGKGRLENSQDNRLSTHIGLSHFF